MENPSLHQDQLDALVIFSEAEVRFLIVGGFAFTAYANMRATKDIDLWVEPSADNSKKVWAALNTFGAPLSSHGVLEEDFARAGTFYQLGLPPVRIDVLTVIADLDFNACWQRRTIVEMEKLLIPYIGLDDLVLAKEAAGRKQDLADLEALYRAQKRRDRSK